MDEDRPVEIRKARPEESEELTAISFAAKRHWDYPEAYFDVWVEELTIAEEYIRKNHVYAAEVDDAVVGYYSIVCNDRGFWLEHIFIQPDYIGKKIGTQLMRHAEALCRNLNCKKLMVLADPHSRGFYEKLGVKYVREVPSNIEDRTVSYFEWNLV
jgi:GNAT superfamily N-acetyltransferase